MSSFEQPNTPPQPEKLPSIAMLDATAQQQQQQGSNFMPTTSYASLMSSSSMMNTTYCHPLYAQNVVSPPLTPAVSPSSFLLDSMQHQFNKQRTAVAAATAATLSGTFTHHPYTMNDAQQAMQYQHHDDMYRRMSTCSAVGAMSYNNDPVSSPATTTTSFHATNFAGLLQQDDDPYPHHDNNSVPSPTVLDVDSTTPTKMDNKAGSEEKRRSSAPAASGGRRKKGHKHLCQYPFCGWSFKRYEHLKRHMLVHTGERPFVCHFPGCGKSFSRSDNFHAHSRTHTKRAASLAKNQQQQQQPNCDSTHNTLGEQYTASSAATSTSCEVGCVLP